MKHWLFYVVGSLLSGSSYRLAAQHAPTDSSAQVAAASLRQHYEQALHNEWSLYNGPEYIDYVRRNTRGHRFFGASAEQPAIVTYGGTTYRQVPLRYDLVRGQLVLRPHEDDLQIYLVNELVEQFSVGEHTFVRLGTDAPGRAQFYDVLVGDGAVRVLAAHYKKYMEHTTATTIEGEITATTDYYIRKDGHYYSVRKAKDVVRLFPAQRTALRSYLQAHRQDEQERAIVELVRYQASLTGPYQ